MELAISEANRAGDRASAGEQCVRQLRDRLLPGIAQRQVSDEPAHHRRKPIAAGVQAARVVGEGDLSVSRHKTETTSISEITQICVISV